jgi:seryl-tRNA synthetase
MLFQNNKQRIQELEASVETHLTTINELKKQCNDYQKTIAAYPLAKQEYEADLEKQRKEYEQALTDFNKKLKESELSVNRKVNEELTKIGVGTFCLESMVVGTNLTNDDEIYKKFMSLAGKPEQTTFYSQYSKEIERAMSKSKKS